ncbi:MAG TPA: putative phage tail protein [Solirubrobacteraceae bacterium]|nr:putative phage tail protein [Solirubrobacteraceae bacterium]
MWTEQPPLEFETPLPPAGVPPSVVALCTLTEAEWTRTLLDLLPRGAVWPRDPGTTLMRFWSAVAIEPTRIQARDCDLLAESYPCGAVELLPDWEAAVGLPNACTELVTWTVAERQALVCAWLAMQGGQSAAYYIWLAGLFGYTITIVEHFPDVAGQAQAGCAHIGGCPFWWEVVSEDAVTLRPPQAGCTGAGEPPCGTGASVLECLITLTKPAHTTVTFRYPPSPREETRHADDA